MKKIFLAFAVFASVWFQTFAQWVDVTPPFMSYDYSCHLSVVSSQTAFVSSRSYSTDTTLLSRTIDGGTTWESKHLPGWGSLLGSPIGIIFINSETGFAIGKSVLGRWIYRTTDGGDNWTSVPLPVSFSGMMLVHFFDSERGVIILRTDPTTPIYEVFTTQNGGQTWTNNTSLNLRIGPYQFQPDGSGVGFTDNSYPNLPTVLTTTDFGQSWQVHDDVDVNNNWAKYRQFIRFQNSYFINDSIGYGSYVENTAPYQPKFYHLTKTIDGGNIWLDDGLVLYGNPFLQMESKEGSIWVRAENYLFRNAGRSTSTEAVGDKNQLTVTPNPLPSGSAFQLKMGNNFSGPAEVQIFHANGAAAQRLMTEVFEGESTLPLAALPAGLYFVTVKSENHGLLATGKLVVY